LIREFFRTRSLPERQSFPPFGTRKTKSGIAPANPGDSREEEADTRNHRGTKLRGTKLGTKLWTGETPNFALKPADVESGFFLALFSDDRVK
jgi:hypothetical protein